MWSESFFKMLEKFRKHVLSNKLIRLKDHILVAVSGGLDSMSLLNLLYSCRDEFDLKISAVHVDHQLRSESSDDRQLVEEFCQGNHIPFYSFQLDPDSISKGQSIEDWGRIMRYDHILQLSEKIDADSIMTAHHGDDQVETLLMHLSEGTGLNGLKGIRERLGNIVRPFLAFSKSEIKSYALENNFSFVEDASNKDLRHPRNFLRHEVIPKLTERYTHLHSSFTSTTHHIQEADDALNYAISKCVDDYVIMEKNRSIVKLDSFEKEPLSFKIYLLKYLLGKNTFWRNHQWNKLKYLIAEGQTGAIVTIGDHEILKDRSSIIIKEQYNRNKNMYRIQDDLLIEDKDFIFERKEVSDHSLNEKSDTETVDGDSLPKALMLRPWESGDQFSPLGMNGTKTVSDFLTDIKMDRFAKRDQYVLANGNEVFWLCGQRISEKIKVTPKTSRFLELSFRYNVG